MHRDSEPSAVELAADVESLFFEQSDGFRDEASVRKGLSSLLNTFTASVKVEPQKVSVVSFPAMKSSPMRKIASRSAFRA